jgi:hypothetical protein
MRDDQIMLKGLLKHAREVTESFKMHGMARSFKTG